MTSVNLTAAAKPLAEVPPYERLPGMRGKFLHSGTMTFVYWDIDEGAALPRHAHHHEQVVNMLEGEFELVVAARRIASSPATCWRSPATRRIPAAPSPAAASSTCSGRSERTTASADGLGTLSHASPGYGR